VNWAGMVKRILRRVLGLGSYIGERQTLSDDYANRSHLAHRAWQHGDYETLEDALRDYRVEW
jgi:hypothetical protein